MAAKAIHHIRKIDNNWTTCARDARHPWVLLLSTDWGRVTCTQCLRQEPLHRNITEPRP